MFLPDVTLSMVHTRGIQIKIHYSNFLVLLTVPYEANSHINDKLLIITRVETSILAICYREECCTCILNMLSHMVEFANFFAKLTSFVKFLKVYTIVISMSLCYHNKVYAIAISMSLC